MRSQRMDYVIIVAFLVAVTLAAYAQVTECGFLKFDDQLYVTDNPQVKAGLTVEGIRWAFAGFNESNWIPVSWISLMVDSWQFGEDAAAFHRTNLILHVLNTLLLFGLLAYATGCKWRSAIVAALFAVHPMHVESVAWIAERKDVLSTFFGFGALWGYAWYCRRPGVLRYAAVTAVFAIGLMAKSMLVTLPILMLLMDVWPLQRLQKRPVWRLIAEKLPFFALSTGICVVTVLAQNSGGAVKPLHLFPIGVRLANAAVAAVQYLWKMIWPANLAFYYPHPGATIHAAVVAACAALLVLLTAVAILTRQNRRYIVVGWLWYAVTLLPVIGIVQVGGQAMADRYTYLPYIGLFVAAVWGIYELVKEDKLCTSVAAVLAVCSIVALAIAAHQEVGYWKDDYVLCDRALAVTRNNTEALYTLAARLVADGRRDEALRYLERLGRIDPQHYLVWGKMGEIYLVEGRYDKAAPVLKKAIEVYPTNTWARLNYALMLREEGKIDEAIKQYKAILEYAPGNQNARDDLEVAEAMR